MEYELRREVICFKKFWQFWMPESWVKVIYYDNPKDKKHWMNTIEGDVDLEYLFQTDWSTGQKVTKIYIDEVLVFKFTVDIDENESEIVDGFLKALQIGMLINKGK